MILLALAAALGTVTVWLARRVLEPAERIEEARRILEDAYDRARSESLRDSLTGLGNHRGFQEEVERQWAMATRHSLPLALAIIDLDDFKQINDTRGHAVGDRLLRQAGATIATYLRRSDRAFRIGGDEFAIIMPGTDAERGHAVVRRLAGRLPRRRGRRRRHRRRSRSRPASAPSRASPATATRSTARPTRRCSGASATAGPA